MTLNGSLKLTGPVLARIFLGQITRWNDPAITALNPGAAWAAQVGAGRSLHWRDGYPMSGYSWVLVSASQSSQATGKALVSLLGWLTGPGQSYAAALGYVPLPHAVQQLAAATLAQVTGPGSQPLTG